MGISQITRTLEYHESSTEFRGCYYQIRSVTLINTAGVCDGYYRAITRTDAFTDSDPYKAQSRIVTMLSVILNVR